MSLNLKPYSDTRRACLSLNLKPYSDTRRACPCSVIRYTVGERVQTTTWSTLLGSGLGQRVVLVYLDLKPYGDTRRACPCSVMRYTVGERVQTTTWSTLPGCGATASTPTSPLGVAWGGRNAVTQSAVLLSHTRTVPSLDAVITCAAGLTLTCGEQYTWLASTACISK